jgi:hypothetical protein
MSVHPTDVRFDRVETGKLHPDGFIEARALDELEPAPLRRDVMDVHHVMVMSAAPELHLRLQGDACAFPVPLRVCAPGAPFDFVCHAAESSKEVRQEYSRKPA